MKIIKVLIGIRDCRFYNPLTLSPTKTSNYSYISFKPLREEGDGFKGNLSTQNACLA